MIVVDSSIWIDWITNRTTAGTEKLSSFHPDDLLVGDIVLLEVLRGAADERHAHRLETRLRRYEVVSMLDSNLAIQAATNYRRLRALGFTIRTVSDLLIGAYCIEHGYQLLQSDRDFQPMAEHLGLRLA